MINSRTIDDPGFTLLDDSRDGRLPRARKLLPRPPKRFIVQTVGNGVRVLVVGWGTESAETVGSSATSYLVYWAQNVDMTTAAGVSGGFQRAILLAPAIPAPGKDDAPASGFFADPQYLTGYFYCIGVDALGNRSDIGNPVFIGSGTGGTIPPDVEHFQASESGEQQNGSTISAVSYSFQIPYNGNNIDHVQFFFKNYPNLNQTSEGQSVRITAAPGGTQSAKLKMPIGRRIGSGTISIAGTAVTGIGTNFLSLAPVNGGGQLEVFGARQGIASVTDNTHMTLTAGWGGPTVTNIGEWQTIASVTIYAVSESFTGARRSDIENAPSVSVDFDGDLSAPLSPSLALVDLANGIKVFCTPPAATQIDSITLYKGKGSGLAFSACTPLYTWAQDKVNSSPFLEYPDFDFATYDKEQGTTFSYYADCRNVRGDRSTPSTRLEYQARLNSSQDVDPSLTGRPGLKNLLYNAMLAGTAGNVVDTDAAGQDAYLFSGLVGPDVPGKPYGGSGQADGTGRYKGYTRWHSTKTAGASALAQFQNNNEVKLPAPGASNSVYCFQEIGSWDDGRAAFMKVKKNAVLVFSIFAKYSGSQPNGSLHLAIEQYNNNVQTKWVPQRFRDTDSVLKLVDSTGGSTNEYTIAGSVLTTSWQRFYAVFICNSALGTTKQIRFTFSNQGSTTGGDIICTQPMINEGEELGLWTADMGDSYAGQPGGTPPGQIGDGNGRRVGRYLQP